MTSTPSTQRCPSCGSFVNYEGHSELAGTLVPHRFHCHSCGRLYIVRSTSPQPPRFSLRPRHEVQETLGHEHHQEEGVSLNTSEDEVIGVANVEEQDSQEIEEDKA